MAKKRLSLYLIIERGLCECDMSMVGMCAYAYKMVAFCGVLIWGATTVITKKRA